MAPAAATALTGPGATASFTATRTLDGGTVLALAAQGAPWRFVPRALVSTQAGGTTVGVAGSAGLSDLSGGIPSADYVTLAVTGAVGRPPAGRCTCSTTGIGHETGFLADRVP